MSEEMIDTLWIFLFTCIGFAIGFILIFKLRAWEDKHFPETEEKDQHNLDWWDSN